MVSSILRRGWAAVAISSEDAQLGDGALNAKCWDTTWPPEDNVDVLRVRYALSTLAKQQGWPEPLQRLYGVGVSSGGVFLTVLARAMPFSGMLLVVSPGSRAALQADSLEPFPPLVAFVYMTRDHWASVDAVHAASEMLAAQGVRAKMLPCGPQPLRRFTLAERIEGFPASLSSLFFDEVLRLPGVLDADGFLRVDPRRVPLPQREYYLPQEQGLAHLLSTALEQQRDRLKQESASTPMHSAIRATHASALLQAAKKDLDDVSLLREPLLSHGVASSREYEAVAEVLNVLYARHEATRQWAEQVFDEWTAVRAPARGPANLRT